MGRAGDDGQVQLLPTDSNSPSSVPLPYRDEPAQQESGERQQYIDSRDGRSRHPYRDNPTLVDPTLADLTQMLGERQQYIDSSNGRPRPLVVQSLQAPYTGQGQQAFGAWETVRAKSNAALALRVAPWVTSGISGQSNAILKALAYVVAVLKAVILSPLFAFLTLVSIENPSDNVYSQHHNSRLGTVPIPTHYPEFKGECREYPKHACSTLDAVPAPAAPSRTPAMNRDPRSASGAEQKRLYRPRKLFVKVGTS